MYIKDLEETVSAVSIRFCNKEQINLNGISSSQKIKSLNTSSIYKCVIDNKEYIHKVIVQSPDIDFELLVNSYKNYECLKSKEGLVKVYDFRYLKDGEEFEILMEYLEDYYDVEAVEANNRYSFALQIFNTIKGLLDNGIIPVDCGLANFVTDGNTVKMLDLDFLLKWSEVNYFQTNWFISRLNEISVWCPTLSGSFDELINGFEEERKKYFGSLPYNPYAQKLIEDGEKILTDSGNIEDAIGCFKTALKYDPYSASIFNNLAVAYWNIDEVERTVSLLKTAFEIEPNNETYIANYIDVLSALKRDDEIQAAYEKFTQFVSANKKRSKQVVDSEITSLQKEIDGYSYPSNYAFDLQTLKPKGSLETRVEYFVKYSPQLFYPCKNFLSVGSSLGYMLLYHSYKAEKCTGIEPDEKANEIVRKTAAHRNINNIELHCSTFKEFEKKDKYDLIWMGNVFQYMYVDYAWEVAKELAGVSSGTCVIEAPFEGEYLKQQAHLNANWKNEKLMNEYTLDRFKEEMGKYFEIISINPSGTDPVNRLLIVLKRK
ncbi:MAG: tetratricopeptide repeat protein [Bacteroidota bacterium]